MKQNQLKNNLSNLYLLGCIICVILSFFSKTPDVQLWFYIGAGITAILARLEYLISKIENK